MKKKRQSKSNFGICLPFAVYSNLTIFHHFHQSLGRYAAYNINITLSRVLQSSSYSPVIFCVEAHGRNASAAVILYKKTNIKFAVVNWLKLSKPQTFTNLFPWSSAFFATKLLVRFPSRNSFHQGLGDMKLWPSLKATSLAIKYKGWKYGGRNRRKKGISFIWKWDNREWSRQKATTLLILLLHFTSRDLK